MPATIDSTPPTGDSPRKLALGSLAAAIAAAVCLGWSLASPTLGVALALAGTGLLLVNLGVYRRTARRSTDRPAAVSTQTPAECKPFIDHDPLTGLLSRAGIKSWLDAKLVEDRPDQSPNLALIYINFDRFKLVNDGISHAAGDELLVQVTARLADIVNQNKPQLPRITAMARCGGDEFALAVEHAVNHNDIDAIAQTLHDQLTHTYTVGGRSVHLSITIGLTSTALPYRNADDMLRDADTAMYQAKRAGRARSIWFQPTMHEAVRDTIELENDLRHAIERDELFLVYQPIISLEDASVTGFETLIRWRHPERGLVRPDKFIHIAEESLLIRPIGRWVLKQALIQTKIWRERFPELTNMVMNVNLSRVQFADPGLTQFITDTLAELDLPPGSLCLEITESTIMDDNQKAIALLKRFRELGFKLAMDDFGTGYSSLSHLHEFPLDSLKIDKAFIDNLSESRDYAAVIHAITALAGNLGFSVVAEGLETPEQIAQLQALACHKGQGYFFHKPAEPEIIEAYLSGRETMAGPAIA